LFFTPEDYSRDFPDVCREVQGYIAANYSSLMTGSADSREQIKRYAAKYIQDKRIAVKGMMPDELVDAIYAEMAEYGFLTKYIFGKGIEEIDINSWRDVEIQYSGGLSEKLKVHFDSPEHAINVIRRINGRILRECLTRRGWT
jgi:pilus assembly protein CpaF